MDERNKKRIELIIEHETERAFRETHTANQSMLAQHSAQGMLQSGGTIKRAIRICSEIAHRVLDELLIAVGKVERSEDAFGLLRQGFEAFLTRIEAEELFYIARVASGRGAKAPDDRAWTACKQEFAVHVNELGQRLEIASFDFPLATDIERDSKAGANTAHAILQNKGGKPLGEHWDAMWAAIAVKLWTGELKPKTQADVKSAMFDWLNEAEIDVGDTALTQRARKLWQAMQSADS